MKPLFYRNFIAGLCMATLAACGGGGGGNGGTPQPTAKVTASASTIEIKNVVTLDGAASTTAGGSVSGLTYQWALTRPANSQAMLSNTSAAQPTFTPDLPGDYTADLIVNDGQANSAPARVVVTVTSPYPVASAPPTISVRLGTENVGLNGLSSTPPTGETGTLTYLWTLKSVPAGSGGKLRDWDKGNATLDVDIEGDYLVQLVVTYKGVDSEPTSVTVTVSKGDAPPVAVAAPVTVKLGEEVVLDGSASYDPDGKPLQYRWRFAAPGSGGTIAPLYSATPEIRNANSAIARFTPTAVGDHQVLFFVYDGTWKSTEIKVDVKVEKPDSFPTVNKPLVGKLVASGYYPSSSVGEQELGLRGNFTFEGYDPEGEAVQFVSAELYEKPADSTAVLEEALPGFGMPSYRKIQKLDKAGNYKVRMVLSDGVNESTYEATIRARIGGINNRPSAGSISPAAASVMVGTNIIFQGTPTSTKDPDGDPLTYKWTLRDKPDGSTATIEPVTEPVSGEPLWAKVLADKPGVYIANLEVEDDRGMKSASVAETQAIAKLTNNAPVLRSIVWNMQGISSGSEPYQLLPCMSLNFAPVVVDPDGDKTYIRRELISTPPEGIYGNGKGKGCNHTSTSFNKPGTYVFRYLISDGIAELPEYDHTVVIADPASAHGLTLARVFAAGTSNEQRIGWHWPYIKLSPTQRDGASSTGSTTPIRREMISLTAADGDYTIVDVKAEHINGNTLTPFFDGLTEGQVIRQGETVDVGLMAAFWCLRNEETLYEGFRWSFRVKEVPEQVFVFENWAGAILNNGATPWPACPAT